jgi:hypothetical protein
MGKLDISAIAEKMVGAVRAAVGQSEGILNAKIEELWAHIRSMQQPQKGDRGEDGRDADMDAVRELVTAAKAEVEATLTACLNALEARLDAIPTPQKGDPGESGAPGRDVDMDAVSELISIEVKEQVSKVPPAKDGAPGKDGQSVHQDTVTLMVREAAEKVAAALPKPKDGRDGFNLEDIQIELGADGRTLSLKFVRGEDVVQRDIRIPAMLYRGVWREGEHEPGDVVTWGGSAWHCGEKTTEKPGASTHWRLMVKEGRPGKDAGGARAPRGDSVVRMR